MPRFFKSRTTRNKEKDVAKVLAQLSTLSQAMEDDDKERVRREDLKTQLKLVGQDLKAIKEDVLPPLTKALKKSHDNGNKMARQVDALTTKLNNAVRESDPDALRFIEHTLGNRVDNDKEMTRRMATLGVDPPSYQTALKPTAPSLNLYPNLPSVADTIQPPLASKVAFSVTRGGQIDSVTPCAYPIVPDTEDEEDIDLEIPLKSPGPSTRTRSKQVLIQEEIDKIDRQLDRDSLTSDKRRRLNRRVNDLTTSLHEHNRSLDTLDLTDEEGDGPQKDIHDSVQRSKNTIEKSLYKALGRSQRLNKDIGSHIIGTSSSNSTDTPNRMPQHTSSPYLLSTHPKTPLHSSLLAASRPPPRPISTLTLQNLANGSFINPEPSLIQRKPSAAKSSDEKTLSTVPTSSANKVSSELHDHKGTLPPLDRYKSYLMLLTDYTDNITITDWVVGNLNRIIHADGTTAHDQLLVNRMTSKLREHGSTIAKEAAEALGSMFHSPGMTWKKALESLAAAYPSGISSLSKNIFQRITSYDPRKDRPLTYFLPIFRAAKVNVQAKISDTINGDIYLSHLRRKLPKSQALLFINAGSEMTWNQLFTKLQEIYNAYAIDDSLSMATSGFGDRNVSRRSSPSLKPYTFAVNTRSGGAAPQGRYAPFSARQSSSRNATSPHPNVAPPRPLNVQIRSTPSAPITPCNQASSFKTKCSPQLETDLGLNEDVDMQRAMDHFQCWFCGRPGHKQTECFAKAVFDLTNMGIYRESNGQYKIQPRHIPVREDILERQRQKWKGFLDGQNRLGRTIATVNDVDTLLTEYRQPSILEGHKAVSGIVRPNNNASACLRDFRQGRYNFQPRVAQTNACYPHQNEHMTAWNAENAQSSFTRALNY